MMLVGIALSICAARPASAQSNSATQSPARRLARLVEANIIATHAYQVLLAKKSGKADSACYSPGKLSDDDLQALVTHQTALLKSDVKEVAAWAQGRKSGFDPGKNLEVIIGSGLVVPQNSPANVLSEYLRTRTKLGASRTRSVASLYQTVLEVERDGDLLQQQFSFYIGLGLPVYFRQLNLAGGDEEMLRLGRELAPQACGSPFATDPAAWQIAARKIWNWGEKHLHVRDERVLATELLREPDVKTLLRRVRRLSPQRIAVVGHSFTMGQHWSSPSSFVPVVIEIFKRENRRVEFRQFAMGGLTASRAQQRFYKDVLDWKPDKVLLVVMTRREQDYESLREMGEGFSAAGVKAYMFDDLKDPESVKPGTAERAVRTARASGIEIIEVSRTLDSAPNKETFLSLDRVHMTEPYHRLMAKEFLKFLVGAGRAKEDGRRGA